jgi:hypothetical protein
MKLVLFAVLAFVCCGHICVAQTKGNSDSKDRFATDDNYKQHLRKVSYPVRSPLSVSFGLSELVMRGSANVGVEGFVKKFMISANTSFPFKEVPTKLVAHSFKPSTTFGGGYDYNSINLKSGYAFGLHLLPYGFKGTTGVHGGIKVGQETFDVAYTPLISGTALPFNNKLTIQRVCANIGTRFLIVHHFGLDWSADVGYGKSVMGNSGLASDPASNATKSGFIYFVSFRLFYAI